MEMSVYSEILIHYCDWKIFKVFHIFISFYWLSLCFTRTFSYILLMRQHLLSFLSTCFEVLLFTPTE
jgi:hypothetical protein